MRKNIEALMNSGITAHAVAVETGIARNTVYRLFNGESSLDNITLKNAEILSNYWEEIKMQKTLEKIWSMVDMEQLANEGGGVTLFKNLEDMMEQWEFTVEEIQRRTSEVGFDVTTLTNEFIVYDYNVAEFEFLTSIDEDRVQQFVDRINNK